MNRDLADNPFLWVIDLMKTVVLDHTLLIFLFILSIITLYYAKSIVLRFLHFIEGIYNKFISYLSKIRIEKTVGAQEKNEKIEKKIEHDIKLNIDMLSQEKKKYAALQYLYMYPSAAGFKAILNFAVDQHEDVRAKLICQLCDSAKKFKWYKCQ